MDRVNALAGYWKRFPPTHILVRYLAQWAGWKPPAADDVKPMSLEELAAMFPTGKIGV